MESIIAVLIFVLLLTNSGSLYVYATLRYVVRASGQLSDKASDLMAASVYADMMGRTHCDRSEPIFIAQKHRDAVMQYIKLSPAMKRATKVSAILREEPLTWCDFVTIYVCSLLTERKDP